MATYTFPELTLRVQRALTSADITVPPATVRRLAAALMTYAPGLRIDPPARRRAIDAVVKSLATLEPHLAPVSPDVHVRTAASALVALLEQMQDDPGAWSFGGGAIASTKDPQHGLFLRLVDNLRAAGLETAGALEGAAAVLAIARPDVADWDPSTVDRLYRDARKDRPKVPAEVIASDTSLDDKAAFFDSNGATVDLPIVTRKRKR